MIAASDLRIGNCIRDIWSSDTACFRVEQLLAKSCTYGLHLKAKYENLIPIPLTEKILLKCGFERKQSLTLVKCYTLDVMKVGFYSEGVEVYFGIRQILNIKYLHELQNLYYALTKNELIINL